MAGRRIQFNSRRDAFTLRWIPNLFSAKSLCILIWMRYIRWMMDSDPIKWHIRQTNDTDDTTTLKTNNNVPTAFRHPLEFIEFWISEKSWRRRLSKQSSSIHPSIDQRCSARRGLSSHKWIYSRIIDFTVCEWAPLSEDKVRDFERTLFRYSPILFVAGQHHIAPEPPYAHFVFHAGWMPCVCVCVSANSETESRFSFMWESSCVSIRTCLLLYSVPCHRNGIIFHNIYFFAL